MLNKQRQIKMFCPKCGQSWFGVVGGYSPKNPCESLETLKAFKEEEASRKCPYCLSCDEGTAKNSEQPKIGGNDGKMENEKKKPAFHMVTPRWTLDSVFLPASSKVKINEALAKIRNYQKIYVEWNFKSVDECGAGNVLNFYGHPGTGKTRTAEGLAGTLNKKFISLGMSDVESKFMGETAKNIRAAFECAKQDDAVLFFDEADTLLGARLSNVTQGIDNEVNSLRSTLLIELERFDGIVIFATNFEKNYDKAFVSRITHHVQFDLPDVDCRQKLWNYFLVAEIPLDEERNSLISKLADNTEGLSGRSIRTCMRLALPKAIRRASDGAEPRLSWADLDEAIQEVRKQRDIGTEVGGTSKEEYREKLKLLGAKYREENSQNK